MIIQIAAVAVVALALGFGYYWYVGKASEWPDPPRESAGPRVSSYASARASRASQRRSQVAGSQLNFIQPVDNDGPSQPPDATSIPKANEKSDIVKPPGSDPTTGDGKNKDILARPLPASRIDSKQVPDDRARGQIISGYARPGSLKMEVSKVNTFGSTTKGGGSSLGESVYGAETIFLVDCCKVVLLCVLLNLVLLGLVMKSSGLSFQQIREHPRFRQSVFAAILVSLAVIMGFMCWQGHFAQEGSEACFESAKGRPPTAPVSGVKSPATISGKPKAKDKIKSGSMTTKKTKIVLEDVDYPIRTSDVVRRVCPPDPCPLDGGGGVGEIDAISGAKKAPEGFPPSQIDRVPKRVEEPTSPVVEPEPFFGEGGPIVASPDASLHGDVGGKGLGGKRVPFDLDVSSAAVVPCNVWIDEEDNIVWAVQERMKKVVDVVDEVRDMSLTDEELACLNRLRAEEGKPPINAGPGVVTRLQEAIYPMFGSTEEKTVEEKPGYISEFQDLFHPFVQSASASSEVPPAVDEEESGGWPWWILLLPLAALIALVICSFYKPQFLSGILTWLKDKFLCAFTWLTFSRVGQIALVCLLLLGLFLLYCLCIGFENEEDEDYAQSATTEQFTDQQGYFEGVAGYVGDTLGQLGTFGYAPKPKETFKISYQEEISEEVWQKLKQRQQSFYVTAGSKFPDAEPIKLTTETTNRTDDEQPIIPEEEKGLVNENAFITDIGSSHCIEPVSGDSPMENDETQDKLQAEEQQRTPK